MNGLLINIEDIAVKIGAKSESKIRQMRAAIRNGGNLPPIRIALVDDTLSDKLKRLGLNYNKKYFLLEGHHRYYANKKEKKLKILSKVVRKMY